MDTAATAAFELMKDSGMMLVLLLAAIALLWFRGKAGPAKRTFVLILLPAGLMMGAFWWPFLKTVTAFYNPLLVVVLLVDRFVLSVEPESLEIRRAYSEKLSINQPQHVNLTLINNSGATVRGRVLDDYPADFITSLKPDETPEQAVTIPPYQQITRRYSLRPLERGTFQFGLTHFQYRSALHLLNIHHTYGRRSTVAVYPDLRQIKAMRVKYSREMMAGSLQQRKMGLEGTEFDGLRNYAVGDDIRKLDWKATARLDMPISRVFTHEVEQPIMVILDAGRKMETRVNGITKFDWALNAALAFTGVALDRGDQVGLGVFDTDVRLNLPPATGKKQLHHILDKVSKIQPQSKEPAYEEVMFHFARSLSKRSLVIIFTDLIDPMASKSLIRSLKQFSKNHLLMVVTLANNELIDLSLRTPETVPEAYEAGVALDFLEVREKSLLTLAKSHGAIVIDTTPDQMDEQLINNYFAVKFKNRL